MLIHVNLVAIYNLSNWHTSSQVWVQYQFLIAFPGFEEPQTFAWVKCKYLPDPIFGLQFGGAFQAFCGGRLIFICLAFPMKSDTT